MSSFPSIVEDVAAVGRALARLERERRMAQFRLPKTVLIVFQFESLDLKAPVAVCYYMNGHTLVLYSIRERSEATLQVIRAFVDYLQSFWPSCHLSQQNAIVLDPEDAVMLKTMLDRASDV